MYIYVYWFAVLQKIIRKFCQNFSLLRLGVAQKALQSPF